MDAHVKGLKHPCPRPAGLLAALDAAQPTDVAPVALIRPPPSTLPMQRRQSCLNIMGAPSP